MFDFTLVRAWCLFLARSYTAVVSACGRAGQWQKAAQYLDEMEAEGTEVRQRSFPIAAVCRHRRVFVTWAPKTSRIFRVLAPTVVCNRWAAFSILL